MLNRGSEWHKWDLHVHTPASIVQNYGGNSEEVWEQYLHDLESLPPEFKVLGINDYLFLDGYERLKREQDSGRLQNIDLLLPVIEFRIEKFAGVDFGALQRINLHVIFSNDVTIEIIKSQFLNTLEQSYQIESSGNLWQRAITRDSIIELGNQLINAVPEAQRGKFGSALQEGFNNLNVKEEQIFKALQKDCFKNKYLIAIGKTEWDQLRWTDASILTKKDIINRADIIFTSSESVEAFQRAKTKLSEQDVNDLLLDCSDAHRFSNNQNKDRIGKCYTWIKANTTFEGLRQILFEPERVCISDNQPSSKNAYQIIKEIKFIDPTNTLFQNDFQLGLNRDLNTIIGGKSSGKSLLLYHLAKTVMASNKFESLSSIPNLQHYQDLPIVNMQAVWEDGHISNLNDVNAKRPIIYIPQMYLNYMAEYKSSNEDFKQTIDEILKGNTGYRYFIETKKTEILLLEQAIDNEIKTYFAESYKLNELNRELNQLGDKTAIEANIKSLREQLEHLRGLAGFTQEEDQNYRTLSEDIKYFLEQSSYLIQEKTLHQELHQVTIQMQQKISSFVEEEFGDLKYKHFDNANFQNIIQETISKITENVNAGIRNYMEQTPFNTSRIDDIANEINNTLKLKQEQLAPLLTKIQNRHTFDKKQQEISVETQKMTTINSKHNEIEIQKTKINLQRLMIPYERLLQCYKDIVDMNSQFSRISEHIELISEVGFHVNDFQRDFSSYISKNRNLQALFEDHGFQGNDFIFSEEEHVINTQYILEKVLDGSLSFNQNKHVQDIVTALLKNYLSIDYDLKQGEDRLGHMSPGKKGIILFQLFLHLSSSQDPILIDQPEDNLDNRTVYKELNDFIKEKKLQRQIIIVSHNSNLVVSTDSENVIVAHQNGTANGRPKFEYINGALENTFMQSSAEHILEQQGIREHVCEILEGGAEAFKKREQKYNI